ncbi:MAG: type IV toxin-antitoxin system AbiEi family antitoxin domain-containing protein [Pseudoclavibacter sp.]
MRRTTYRDIVHEIAADNYGYVTTRDAEEAGVPKIELVKLATRNRFAHIAYGLYRDETIPHTARDEYAEATLRAGEGAFLRGEAVLALLGLADANPRIITVATPKRTRRSVPTHIALTRAPRAAKPTVYEGIAAQPVVDALLECQGRLPAGRLLEAAAQARAEGYLTGAEITRVREALAA